MENLEWFKENTNKTIMLSRMMKFLWKIKKTIRNSKIYNKNKIHREQNNFLLILCSIIEIQPEEEKLKNDCYEMETEE